MVEKLTDDAPRYSLADRIAQWREQAAQCRADIEAGRTLSPYPIEGAQYLQGREFAFDRCADEAELTLKPADPEGEQVTSSLKCQNGHVWSSTDCTYRNGLWDWRCDCGQLDRDFPPDEITNEAPQLAAPEGERRPPTDADVAITELLKLIHGFVTGDGQQLENLDFDEAYWRGQATDDHLDAAIHVENWLAMLEAIKLFSAEAAALPRAPAPPSDAHVCGDAEECHRCRRPSAAPTPETREPKEPSR